MSSGPTLVDQSGGILYCAGSLYFFGAAGYRECWGFGYFLLVFQNLLIDKTWHRYVDISFGWVIFIFTI